MSFINLNISRKLGLAFFAVVATILVMSATIYWNLSRIEQATMVEEGANQSSALIKNAEFRLGRQENSYRGYLLSGDPFYIERLQSHRASFDKHLADLVLSHQGRDSEAAIKANVATVKAAMDAWQSSVVDAGIKLFADPANRARALEMVGQTGSADGYMEKIEDSLALIDKSEREQADLAAQMRDEAVQFTSSVLIIGLICAVSIALVLGVLMSRVIARPITALTSTMGRLAAGDNSVEVPAVARRDEIGEMAKAVLVFKEQALEKLRLEGQSEEHRASTEAERSRNEAEKARTAQEDHIAITSLAEGLSALAEGDLTYRITAPFSAKTQKLKDDFNQTAEQLQQTMVTITSAIGGIRSGTGEVSQAADDLSRRTEQQAASLEETAAALDEITATVKTTADGASRASTVTAEARTGAERSGEVVREAVAAMAQIERSSQQIGQIIGVIDEIAFQTNLLALNAGVEAARAGDAGKGFAVVASEVRALAQRSAEAAREIKELISTSTRQVEQGVSLVDQTGEALEKIVSQVGEITGLVTEIAASAREQSTGLGEVNTAVNQMDQVTQQNAAMVEQSTAASHHLAQEAEELARLVARFRVGEQSAHASSQGTRAKQPAPAVEHRPQARSMSALKTVSTGGGAAAALLSQQPAENGWEEF